MARRGTRRRRTIKDVAAEGGATVVSPGAPAAGARLTRLLPNEGEGITP